MGRNPNEIPSIQVLRAVAAPLVFGSHLALEIEYAGNVHIPHWSGIGAVGVDLFFVISGFIMVHASRNMLVTPSCGANSSGGGLSESYHSIGWLPECCFSTQ